jgi:hypothetical protein
MDSKDQKPPCASAFKILVHPVLLDGDSIAVPPSEFYINPGRVPAELLRELFVAMSAFNVACGGEPLQFLPIEGDVIHYKKKGDDPDALKRDRE